jgi:hypothetical protein
MTVLCWLSTSGRDEIVISEHCGNRHVRLRPACEPAHDAGPSGLASEAHRALTDAGDQLVEVIGELLVLEALREVAEPPKSPDAPGIAGSRLLERLTGSP